MQPFDINPCTYLIAAPHGCGLRDTDLTKAFGRMLGRKLQGRKQYGNIWALIPKQLLPIIDVRSLLGIYNIIYFSITKVDLSTSMDMLQDHVLKLQRHRVFSQ